MLGLVLDDEPRRRGRPPKVRSPEEVDHVDLRAFAVTQTVLREHMSELKGDRCADGCRFQYRLRQLGYRIAYLPGQLAAGGRLAAGPSGAELEADLAFHPGEREAMARLQQSYRLGEEVLTPAPPATTRSSRSWPRRSTSARPTTCRSATRTRCAAPAATGCASRRTTSSDARPDARAAGGRVSGAVRRRVAGRPGRLDGAPPARARRGAGGRLSSVRLQPGAALRRQRLGAQHLGRGRDPGRGRHRARGGVSRGFAARNAATRLHRRPRRRAGRGGGLG